MADDASRDQPTTAVEAAADPAAPQAETTGTSSLVDDIAAEASLLASGPPTTGTATPFELDPEQAAASLKVSLADLTAKANAQYAQKNYEDAAEVFAQAAEMQAEMNGEMDPVNAEILFLYGRALFKVGQSKSDVLGGKASTTEGGKPAKKQKSGAKKANGAKKASAPAEDASAGPAVAPGAETQEQPSEADRVAEEAVKIIADQTSGAKEEPTVDAKKPLFQFTGDENFDDSDEEDAEEGEGEEDEEEEDDLASAFEILDLARVLYHKRLEAGLAELAEGEGKGKDVSEGDNPSVRHIKERLGDTHDILAEISLENERFPNAVADMRESLKYKIELYPEESEVIAEAHFKLSLALEFASVTTSEEEAKNGPQTVDQDLRDEAVKELEAAIASTKLKLQNQEVELATLHSPEDNESTRKQIAEAKEVIAEMEQRLTDLKKPPVDVNAAVSDLLGGPMEGVLGMALGESASDAKARIEEAKKTANDLSGLVRKKAKDEPKAAPPAAAEEETKANGHGTNGNGKRPAEEPADVEADAKKTKVEDAVEA